MTIHRGLVISVFLSACLGTLALAGTAVAGEGSPYLFDANLSLTGDCSSGASTPVDTIPDPGCPAGLHPPSGPFVNPHGVAADQFGDIYVSSYGSNSDGSAGRVDVFGPTGLFISELTIPSGPEAIAVDSEGNLYVYEQPNIVEAPRRISLYGPTTFEPASGNIEYNSSPTTVIARTSALGTLPNNFGIAVNPANDHLFVDFEDHVVELSSAKEGNAVVDTTIGQGNLKEGKWLAVDAAHDLLYVTDWTFGQPSVVRVFKLSGSHELLSTITGSDTPSGSFQTELGYLLLATDEGSGKLFVGDMGKKRVRVFDSSHKYLETIEHSFVSVEPSAIAVDNGSASPNQGYLFVTSGFNGPGHSYAFELPNGQPPVIESLSAGEISETDAELTGVVNPGGLETEYKFEFVSQQDFEAEGFANGTTAGAGTLAASGEGVEVSAAALNLLPGTSYRFRLVAENENAADSKEAAFATFPALGSLGPCPNEAFRTEQLALLPDCRAWELVTPPDLNGRTLFGPGGVYGFFPSFAAAGDGSVVTFNVQGGSLPGTEGTGAFTGEYYQSRRGSEGWGTTIAGPSGSETVAGSEGGISPDQGYLFWTTHVNEEGTAAIEKLRTSYVRYPDGHSELLGQGSLATDFQAEGKLISPDGTHIVFETGSGKQISPRIEPDSPPLGTQALYDRTPDGITHVVSLLPGDVPQAAGENVTFEGASIDGEGVAFKIGAALYFRKSNQFTVKVTEGPAVEHQEAFAGVSAGGRRIFYVEGGDLFAYDVQAAQAIPFTESGDATVVNVSSEGDRAYFVSPSVLTTEPNPVGALPQAAAQNLYLSEEGAIKFVGTLTDRDVEGENLSDLGIFGGLGQWTERVMVGWPPRDPSRTTPSGEALVFESRADLTGFDSGGHAEVYRYLAAGQLDCLSCSPTGVRPIGDANLQSLMEPAPLGDGNLLPNVRADGNRVFFQTPEPLVANDTDGLLDVYEWEADGVGTCARSQGCVYLISSGHSNKPDYLYAISDSGEDVFVSTLDRLLPRGTGTTYAIYDARVGGGFAEEPEESCQGEGCHLPLTTPPALVTPASEAGQEGGNVTRRSCPKGKQKVRRHGKVRCVKKSARHHHRKHRPARARKGGAK